MGKDIVKYADEAMYDAQPIQRTEGARVTPRVFLLDGPRDPLGTLAADWRMYRGDPVYSLEEITDELRHKAWDDFGRTVLNTPLEGVQLKFMIEAVTRSFTHQMVRQRVGAYYVQESLRFAVKKGLAKEVALPPSIITELNAHEGRDQLHGEQGVEASDIWHDTVVTIQDAYEKLIALGVPAEVARGLLPHAVTTRIIYCTNLRSLFENAGKRLCTQAQFEWRLVFLGIMNAIHNYKTEYFKRPEDRPANDKSRAWWPSDWQYELIAQPSPMTFTPQCYHDGKCGFMASLDRGCKIRNRVDRFAYHGVPPEEWGKDSPPTLQAIHPEEWMFDPSAGITTKDNRPQ